MKEIKYYLDYDHHPHRVPSPSRVHRLNTNVIILKSFTRANEVLDDIE
jgi:hypothetical protein